ncbi:MAG TPA: c-type cytochrome domain-containing protein, partial [Bacteroidia bacterium]
MKNSSLFIFLSLSLLLVTCTKDSYNPDVCFSKNVLPIFVSNCTMSGCHNSADHKAGLDLSNYDGIMNGVTPKHPLFSSVYNSVSGNNPSMPPRKYPKLNSLE